MMSSVNHDDLAYLKIPLESIRSATSNFDEINIIYTSKFEKRYEGQLLWSGELIKIRARRWLNKERDDEKEQQFWTEISLLSTLQHKNLISLVGFCDENDEKIIIINLETRHSLRNYLSDTMMLTWVRRLEICVGLGNALSYIHHDETHDFSIIHRNIDSGTVLLNDNWEAKLSGFELSMMVTASERHLSFDVDKVSISDGCTDPTYEKTKSAHHKSDIYSFGIVMFELLCGREAVINDDQDNKYLAPMAILHYREEKLEDIVEWNLWKQIDPQSFKVFTEIAYDCLNEERSQRPSIDEIVTKLEKALKLACENRSIMSLPSNQFAHLQVPLQNILSATKNFAQENHISTTRFAKEYKGQLLWSGELIDITARRLNKEMDDDDEQMFWMEILMLSTLKHKNLVSLVGFCDDNDEKIIINRRETRGSLSNYLSDPMLLTWLRRLEISVSIAHALSYIHYDDARDFSVIHRYIDSSRVRFNDEWEPKLCDFEHSMKIKASQRNNSFHTNRVTGVNGYVDPTYLETKRVSHKSDIYSFGIVMFELLCGRKSIIDSQDNKYLGPVAIFHYKKKILYEIIDPVLWKQMDPQSFKVFAEIAYECLNEEQSQRPNIDEIVARLESALELQMESQNVVQQISKEHSIVAAEVEDTSSNHDKGSLTSIPTRVGYHVSKETKSFLRDISHLNLSWEDIASATNNFAQESIMRTFKLGTIYKGRILHSEQFVDIIVKRFYTNCIKDESKKIWTEISMLASLKHKNLVSLIGIFDDGINKMIIYKKEANCSLKKYLSDQTLTWMQRLKICVGVANALSFIHYDAGRDFSVIHCNITSSNILLDDKWEPKLSSFELSLKNTVARRHRLLLTRDVNKNVYLDPKYEKTGGLTHKSDVYSFGVVLLEVLCGLSAIVDDEDEEKDEDEQDDGDGDDLGEGLLSKLAKSHLDDLIMPHLRKEMDTESLKIFTETAYWCIKEDRADRPYIDQVVIRLKKALDHQWKHENPVLKRTSPVQYQLKCPQINLKLRYNGQQRTVLGWRCSYSYLMNLP